MMRLLALVTLLCLGGWAALAEAQLFPCQQPLVILIPFDDFDIPVPILSPQCRDHEFVVDGQRDHDADFLPDAWELKWFGDTTTASGRPEAPTDHDGDGFYDAEEFRYGLNPQTDDVAVSTQLDTFRYDPVGQFISGTTAGRELRLDYDAAGNPLSISVTGP